MDSSKHHLGTEGCSSSESGWTMYIASPMQEDDDCSDDLDENDHHPAAINGKADDDNNENELDSDDSMASDASSGPHHYHKQERDRDYGKIASFKRSNGNNFNLCSSATKPNKKEKKNDGSSSEKNRRLTANGKYSK